MQVFLDTNIIVYAYDRDSGQKHRSAVEILKRCWLSPTLPFISVQVVQELHATLLRFGYSTEESIKIVEQYLTWRVISLTPTLLHSAHQIRSRWQLSVWDSAIVAAAQEARTTELWSEDLQVGQRFGELVVVNPLI